MKSKIDYLLFKLAHIGDHSAGFCFRMPHSLEFYKHLYSDPR